MSYESPKWHRSKTKLCPSWRPALQELAKRGCLIRACQDVSTAGDQMLSIEVVAANGDRFRLLTDWGRADWDQLWRRIKLVRLWLEGIVPKLNSLKGKT